MHRPPEIKPHNVAPPESAQSAPPAPPRKATLPVKAPLTKAPQKDAIPPEVRVPLKARMVFWRQFATCLKGGMTLAATLHHLQNVTRHAELREAARKAQICVERGGSLAAWMKTRPQAFSRGEAALILAGETSGDLDKVSDRIAADLENEHTLRRKLFTATFINKFIVLPLLILVPGTPSIFRYGVEAFEKHGQNLGLLDQQKLIVREGLKGYLHDLLPRLITIGIMMAVLYVAWRLAMTTQPGRKLRDQLAMKVPLTGPLWRDLAIFRYLTALGYLTNAGIQPAAALEATQGIAGNVVLDEKFARAAALARKANLPLGEALAQSNVFSDVTLSLVRTGEASGSTPAMFAQAAAYYETDVTQRMTTVPKTIGIIAFLTAAIATVFVVGMTYTAYINTVFEIVPKFMGVE